MKVGSRFAALVRWPLRALLAAALLAAVPATVVAHPLGNFTINHYSGLRIAADRVTIDHVIDMAEIPAFQARQQIDRDGDGALSAAENEAYRAEACSMQARDLELSIDARPMALSVEASAVAFPAGVGGLETLRLNCLLSASLEPPIEPDSVLAFGDNSYAARIGWREIVLEGDGVTVLETTAERETRSDRLQRYPDDLLAQPLELREVSARVAPGGPALAPFVVPELASQDGGQASVPGGIAEATEIGALVNAPELTPSVVAGALLLALALGAYHALTPGHGKTVMAAYLVGTRGSARHAVALGLTVAVAHTLGVLALAALTTLAARVLPPERLYPWLGVASGLIVVGIGLYLLASRLSFLPIGRAAAQGGHAHGLGGWHTHEPTPPRPPRVDAGHDHAHGSAHDHGHGSAHDDEGERGHSHRHETERDPLRWRGLFALGLSGGLVPSASALVLLLGSVSVGRPGYGMVLVVAFGLGMALVLTGIGLVLVYGQGRIEQLLERLDRSSRVPNLARLAPLATAVIVLVVGLAITGQAAAQVL
ncbi:MAG: nickel transporter [Chloroflexi bacterium]|nr:nickel transporter [Chloroflexota bacterium]